MSRANAVRYIDTAVLSLLSQIRSDFRILAYDNHSTDGTFERLLFWQKQDDCLCVSKPFSEHQGYVQLLNQMLNDTTSDYVARQDADDISLPHRLDVQYSFMEEKCGAVACGTQGFNIIEREGGRISSDYPWESRYVNPVASYNVPVNQALKKWHRVIHGTLFGVRDAIRQVGGYDEGLEPIEDWNLALDLSQIGDVYVLPQVCYLRRIHDDNISKNHPNKEKALQIIINRHNLNSEAQSTRPNNL